VCNLGNSMVGKKRVIPHLMLGEVNWCACAGRGE
jgi:hypothetical protein